jgi:hypothetical protein
VKMEGPCFADCQNGSRSAIWQDGRSKTVAIWAWIAKTNNHISTCEISVYNDSKNILGEIYVMARQLLQHRWRVIFLLLGLSNWYLKSE